MARAIKRGVDSTAELDPIAAAPRADQVAVWVMRSVLTANAVRRLAGDKWDTEQLLSGLSLPAVDCSGRPQALRRIVGTRLGHVEAGTVCRAHDVFANVETLGGAVDLNPAERELMALAALFDLDALLATHLGALLEGARGSFHRSCELMGRVMALPGEAVKGALGPTGSLCRSGLLSFDPVDAGNGSNPFMLSVTLARVLQGPVQSREALVECLIPQAPGPRLVAADFAHLGDDLELLRRYLERSVADRRCGVNVLLYGPPGTGKTELARLVGALCPAQVHEVAVRNETRGASERAGRLRSFLTCQALLAPRGGCVVIFDELEDALPVEMAGPFGMRRNAGGDKGWFNRLLEDNPVPAIWISNEISQIDPAILRRFDLVLSIQTPPRSVRAAIAACSVADLDVTPGWSERVAGDGRATPADYERAARVVRVTGADGPTAYARRLDRVLELSLSARHGAAPAAYPHDARRFDPRLSATDTDLELIVAGLARRRRGSLCLYGPPGTGKTAFAHHLARALDRPLIHKRASDLLSMWVGQSEKMISGMFHEARAEDAVLLLDEADSFLRDRRNAVRAWEVTQVNELLVQMEAHRGVFVCATNLCETLDPAAFRRFDLKVRFEAPGLDALLTLARGALEDLGVAVTGEEVGALRAELQALVGLSPGDVRTAARRFEVLGLSPTHREMVAALRSELSFRQEDRRSPVGFRAGGSAS